MITETPAGLGAGSLFDMSLGWRPSSVRIEMVDSLHKGCTGVANNKRDALQIMMDKIAHQEFFDIMAIIENQQSP